MTLTSAQLARGLALVQAWRQARGKYTLEQEIEMHAKGIKIDHAEQDAAEESLKDWAGTVADELINSALGIDVGPGDDAPWILWALQSAEELVVAAARLERLEAVAAWAGQLRDPPRPLRTALERLAQVSR